ISTSLCKPPGKQAEAGLARPVIQSALQIRHFSKSEPDIAVLLKRVAHRTECEMEILCACDEGYVPHTATMLCSLLEHNAFVRVHLFHSSIGSRTLDKLIKFVVRYGGAITSYEMIADDFDYCQVDGWASIANYYRLVAPHFIGEDIDKILYLDSDLIVRQSLDKLWNTDVTD